MAESMNRSDARSERGAPLGHHRAASTLPAKPFQPGLPTGMGLGKYRILERIKTTHNAIVYRARDALLDRLVTIKQMMPSLIDDPIACGHFRREAQFLARIPRGNSHVLGILELIEDDLGLFLVEEYVPGEWLESLISKRRLDLSGSLRIFKTAALGLRTLHSLNIAHRGIHPGNILMARNGKAKITNLSTAAQESDTTPPPVIAPKYSAPELLLGEEYDNRVDIYSLGIILFEMCVGRPALNRHFAAMLTRPTDTKARWIEWHTDMRASLPNASSLNPLIPPRLAALIRQMTAKNLDDRVASIQDVLKSLAEPHGEDFHTSPYPRLGAGFPGMLMPEYEPPGAAMSRVSLAFGVPTPPPAKAPFGAGPRLPTQLSTRTVNIGDTALPPTPTEAAVETPPESTNTATPPLPRHPTRTRMRRRTTVPAGARFPARIEVIPPPPAVTEVAKEHHHNRLAWAIAALLFLTVTLGGGYFWHLTTLPPSEHPILTAVQEADAAMEIENFKDAREKYLAAATMDIPPSLSYVQTQAGLAVILVDAERALAANDFVAAENKLREARRRGADAAKVDKIQGKLWSKKDAYRLAAESNKELNRGDFASVELKLDEYEKKARASGADPNQLRDRLEISRQDHKHVQAMELAQQSLDKNNYEGALLAITDAENIKVTSETRQLHKRILDRKKQAELILRGDDAMLSKDFKAAVAAYESANQLETSEEIEGKVRAATALLLSEEADKALSKGDLLVAEQKLRSSLWRYRIPSVANKLDKLAPAFEAARLVRKADQAMAKGDYAEAEQIYSTALPNLPEPADAPVREKLEQIRQGKTGGDTQKSANARR